MKQISLFYAENVLKMRKMRKSANYADPHHRILSDALEGETHFHMNGFARRLVLKQRQRVTRNWPIEYRRIISDYS